MQLKDHASLFSLFLSFSCLSFLENIDPLSFGMGQSPNVYLNFFTKVLFNSRINIIQILFNQRTSWEVQSSTFWDFRKTKRNHFDTYLTLTSLKLLRGKGSNTFTWLMRTKYLTEDIFRYIVKTIWNQIEPQDVSFG